MKLKVWCDSGANIHSKREDIYELEELGLTLEEWNEMSSVSKEDFIKDIALERLDWGYELIDGDLG